MDLSKRELSHIITTLILVENTYSRRSEGDPVIKKFLEDNEKLIKKLASKRDGKIKRIHINQQVIRSNKKNGTSEPPITIRESKTTRRVSGVEIQGPSVVIYSPDKPLSCGARVWIETRAEVKSCNEDIT
jgi:hypothetical protein